VGVVPRGTHWVSASEQIHLVQPVQRVFHHQLSQLLVLYLVVPIGVEVRELGVVSQLIVHMVLTWVALNLQLQTHCKV
jgi:hypothetical protein